MKAHAWDLSLVLLCLALLFGCGAAILLLPHSAFSETENRALTTWQAPTLRQLADGSFTERIRDLVSDQFPLRPHLTALKATAERCLGKQENNGILFGKEGYLIPRGEQGDPDLLENNLLALAELERLALQAELPCSACIVPRSVDVNTAFYPRLFSQRAVSLPADRDSWHFPLALLRDAASRGVPVWYKTDHHWTTEGAYLVYRSLAESLGIEPYPPDTFTPVTVTDSFLGTSHSKAGGLAGEADTVVLYRYPEDGRFTVRNHETGEVTPGFYDTAALTQKDKYKVFLGGNYSHLSITDPTEQKPRLLLIKDSFANALIPFLALHFDMDVIDPRYHKGALALSEYDRILVVQGLDTLSTDPSLERWIKKQKQSQSP